MSTAKKTLVLGASPVIQSDILHRAATELMHYKHPVELLGIKDGAINGQDIDKSPKMYDGHRHGDDVSGCPAIKPNTINTYLPWNPNRVVFNPGAEK